MCKQIILSSDFLWILYFPWPVPTPRFTISVWISHSSFLSVQLSFFTGFLGFSSQSLTWVLSLSKLKVINPFSTSPPLPHPLCGCSQLQFSLCAPSFVPAFWKDSLHRYLPVLSATWAFLSPVTPLWATVPQFQASTPQPWCSPTVPSGLPLQQLFFSSSTASSLLTHLLNQYQHSKPFLHVSHVSVAGLRAKWWASAQFLTLCGSAASWVTGKQEKTCKN